ncbi:MAG TPA: caspase family protein [Kofleriaceae bacterium]|nr:caspase family protein [Kofleriaceae bacterium]
MRAAVRRIPIAAVLALGGSGSAARAGADAAPRFVPAGSHSERIVGAVLVARGTMVVSAGADATVRSWDLATGLPLRHVALPAPAAAFHFDGARERFIVGLSDGTVQWFTRDLERAGAATAGGWSTQSVAIDHAGRRWAAGDLGRTIHTGALDSDTSSPCQLPAPPAEAIELDSVIAGPGPDGLGARANGVISLAFSPDDALLASGDGLGFVHVWKTGSCEVVASIEAHQRAGHAFRVVGLAFTGGGDLVTAGSDGAIRTWSADGWRLLTERQTSGQIVSFALSPGGRVVVGHEDGSIELDGVAIAKAHTGPVSAIELGGAEDTFLSAGGSAWGGVDSAEGALSIRQWRTSDRRLLHELATHHKVNALAAAPGSAVLWVGHASGDVRRWDLATIHARVGLDGVAAIADLDATASGDLWVAAADSVVRIGRRGVEKVEAREHTTAIAAAGTTVVRGGLSGVEGTRGGRPYAHPYGNVVSDLALSRDGRRLLIGGWSGLELASVDGGSSTSLVGHGDVVEAVAFSPDGRLAASGSWDRTARLWDLASGQPLHVLPHAAEVAAVAFSGDGSLLLTGGDDGVAILWEVATGARVATLTGHTGPIAAVAFAGARGELLATGSHDGSVKLWSRAGVELAALLSHGDEWMIYTPDGHFEASRGGGALVSMVLGDRSFSIEQFAHARNRPDLIARRLGTGSRDTLAHFAARVAARERDRVRSSGAASSRQLTVPVATIVASERRGETATLDLRFEDAGGDLDRYDVYVNGVPLDRGVAISGARAEVQRRVQLSGGTSVVEVSAIDRSGTEAFRAREIFVGAAAHAPELYVVAIGVSDYARDDLDLEFAAQDAVDLAALLQASRTAGRVHAFVRVNRDVTRDTFEEARRFLRGASIHDTAVVFVAGHGLHEDTPAATYYFLTHEADPDHLATTAASLADLESVFDESPARARLLLIDTCESGDVAEEQVAAGAGAAGGRGVRARVARSLVLRRERRGRGRPFVLERDRFLYNDLSRRTGAVVYSSTTGGDLSYERKDLRNGLFTESLLRALTTTATDRDRDGAISLDELQAAVGTQVVALSGGRQHPVVDRNNPHVHLRLPLVPGPPPVGVIQRRPRGCGCHAGAGDGVLPVVLAMLLVIAAPRTRKAARAALSAGSARAGTRSGP